MPTLIQATGQPGQPLGLHSCIALSNFPYPMTWKNKLTVQKKYLVNYQVAKCLFRFILDPN